MLTLMLSVRCGSYLIIRDFLPDLGSPELSSFVLSEIMEDRVE